jgi:hypothetical protein
LPTESLIRRIFNQFGTIIDVIVKEYAISPGDVAHQQGYGFVTYEDQMGALNALQSGKGLIFQGIAFDCTPSRRSDLQSTKSQPHQVIQQSIQSVPAADYFPSMNGIPTAINPAESVINRNAARFPPQQPFAGPKQSPATYVQGSHFPSPMPRSNSFLSSRSMDARALAAMSRSYSSVNYRSSAVPSHMLHSASAMPTSQHTLHRPSLMRTNTQTGMGLPSRSIDEYSMSSLSGSPQVAPLSMDTFAPYSNRHQQAAARETVDIAAERDLEMAAAFFYHQQQAFSTGLHQSLSAFPNKSMNNESYSLNEWNSLRSQALKPHSTWSSADELQSTAVPMEMYGGVFDNIDIPK